MEAKKPHHLLPESCRAREAVVLFSLRLKA